MQESTRWEGHSDSAQRHSNWFRLPQRFRPIALIKHQPGQLLGSGKIKHRLGRGQSFDRQPLEAEIDPLIGQCQFDIDGDPPPIGSGTMTSLQLVRELVKHGADVNTRLKEGRAGRGRLNQKEATPFLLAADTADVPYMKLLLELGADPTLTNADEPEIVFVPYRGKS